MKLGKFHFAALAALALVAVAGATRAGWRAGGTLSLSSTSASGALGNIRNSSNSTEYAACSISSNGGARSAFCLFVDSAGVGKSCSTSDADLVNTIGTMVSDSTFYITFNASGACTSVAVSNSSYAAPKLF
jgi:hypothetical protein